VTGIHSAGEIRIWDVATGEELAHFGSDFGAVFDVSFFPDGKQIVTGGRVLTAADRGAVRIWNVETHETSNTLLGHTR
jgi:WD40 repeat protein